MTNEWAQAIFWGVVGGLAVAVPINAVRYVLLCRAERRAGLR